MSHTDAITPQAPAAGAGLCEDDRLPAERAIHHRDYALHDYEPRCDPAGRLHSASMLRHLLRHEGMLDVLWPVIETVWGHLGHDETVWGAKWTRNGFHSFELYFYNYDVLTKQPQRVLSSLRRALRPWLEDIPPLDPGGQRDEPSTLERVIKLTTIDFEPICRETRRASGAHVYTAANVKTLHRDIISYGVRAEGLRLENHYMTLFAEELDLMRNRLRSSVHARTRRAQEAVLLPELRRCYRMMYAIKPWSDGLYFNRVTSEQTEWFATQFLPPHVAAAFAAHRHGFAHLYWDVGIDFVASPEREEQVALRKFGMYGYV